MKITLFSLATAAFVIASVSSAPVKKNASVKKTSDNKVVVGYWVPWGDVPVSALDMSTYTHVNYGFGTLKKSSSNPTDIIFDVNYDGANMIELVSRGQQSGVPILMTIGGWTGSETFSTIVADSSLRSTFISNAMIFVRKNTNSGGVPNGYDMDGIDIDWEYPGHAGAPNNAVAPQDSANYLLLLKELRAALDSEFPNDHKLITAAVNVQPFAGANGSPLSDVSAYAKYFDWISIMAYDIYGTFSSTTGPVAPFGTPSSPNAPYSVVQSIESWTSAGWPSNKLVLGTAFYGTALTASVNMNKQNPITQFVPVAGPSMKKRRDSHAYNETIPHTAIHSAVSRDVIGSTWRWKDLRASVLTGGPTTTASGWTRHWDSQTQTPWVFRSSDNLFISYDDIESLTIKTQYAKKKNLRGVMLWDTSYDYNQELITVLNEIHCTTNCPSTPKPTSPSNPPSPSPTTTTITNPAPSPTVSPSPGSPGHANCAGVSAWSTSTVYSTVGTKVTYGGHLWTNLWWTEGDIPSSAAWSVWKDN
ncbi:hypothetical protein BGZ49_008302, partial [Haplosporangium sp. Z 27]